LGRAHFNKTSFLGGELSPKIQGRIDIPHYQHGADELTNFIVGPQGGIKRRPGSKYFADLTSVGIAALIPWIVNPLNEECYLFYFETGSSNPTFAAYNTIDGTSLTSGSGLSFAASFSKDHLGLDYSIISRKEEFDWAIADNKLVIVHPFRPPIIVRRNDKNDFSVYQWEDAYSLTHISSKSQTYLKVPYLEYNDDTNTGETLTFSSGSYSVGTNVTVTASGFAPFSLSGSTSDQDIGTFWKVQDSNGNVTVFEIEHHVNNTTSQAYATIRAVDSAFAGPSSTWAPQAWGTLAGTGGRIGSRGWPQTVAFHENRLIFGGTRTSPNTIWASKAFDIGEMSVAE